MTRFRWRVASVVSLLALIVGILGVTVVAKAVTVSNGTVGSFEDDGNMAVDNVGTIDWASVASSATKVVDDNADSGFQGSSKEEDPANWTCNNGGGNPPKGDIQRAYVNPRIDPGSAYLDLAWVRAQGNGDAHVNFEFDKQPTAAASCPINRNIGDFMVTYDFPGGSSPANIRAWTWGGAQWNELTLQPSDAAAATNSGSITDPLNGDSSIGDREFGEVTLNLLAAGLPSDLVGCPGFGTVNVRTRSSGESITSALQDKLPSTAVDLSTCGKIIVHKVDDHVPPQALAGATFGLFDNAAAAGAALQTCISQADGSCTFDKVTPADYWVKEISAPAGYTASSDIRKVTVGFRETKDLTTPFVDPRDTGWARIVKELRDPSGALVTVADPHALDGAAFVLYSDKNNNGALDAGETAKLWPAETADAACSITGPFAGSGHCDIGPVVPGSYRVHETATPPGTTAGSDVDITVVKSTSANPATVHYANHVPALDLNLVKSGPALAHVGDTFPYTFDATTNGPRLHNITLAEVGTNRCTTPISVASGDSNNNGFLEKGETWHWTCDHTVSAGDPNPLPNTAKVTGTDDFGRSVNATDDHSVIIIHPTIKVEKSGPALAHEGDKVTYSFKVTNTGDVALSDVKLSDNKLGVVGTTIAVLSAGDSQTFTGDYVVPAGNAVDNTVTACGDDPLSRNVCDDDNHHLDVIHPKILVEKSGPATAHVGDKVTYSFKVTNTGDDTLTNVQVNDDKIGAIGTIPSLAKGASTTLTKDFNVPDVPAVDNTVTACGLDPLSLKVCDDDHHHLVPIHPAVMVEKSGPASAHVGDVVTYTFKVTNTGDVDLTNVAVTDDKIGAIGTIPSLAKGASTTLTKDFTVPSVAAVDNTATACGFDPLSLKVCDDDHHHLVTIHPGIMVEKSGPAQAHEGDKVTYSFKVTNTGDVDLANVKVDDDKLGSIGTIPSLAKGASTTLTKDYTIPTPSTAGIDNTVTACGDDPLSKQVCDTDHHHLDPIHPKILVEKSGPATSHVGDKVTYTFKVTNTGDVALTNVAVNDDKIGAIGTIPSLATGASTTLTKDFTVPDVAAVDNTVTACGFDPLSLKVCDDDHHHLVTIHPAIKVEKSGPATAHEGDKVTYSFKVTNTGDVDLTNVAVTDDKLGSVGTIGDLAVGASKTLTKDFTIPTPSTAGIDNTATACGDDPLSLEVCDTDHHHLDPIHPKIAIVKSGPALAHIGDTITYKFEVTNPGDVPLHDVALTDPKCNVAPKIDAKAGTGDDILDLADHWFYSCDHKITAGDPDPLPNTGTVNGLDPLDKTVTANDDHTVDIIHPAIKVEKSGPAEAHEGDKVTYSFKVSNVGDVALTNVTVVDDKLGNVGTISSLNVGASTTLSKDFTVPSPSVGVDNTVTACGNDPLSVKVCDDDHHHLTPKHPAITVVKSGPAAATAGQTVTYTFKITNTGDIDLKNVQVNDDKLGAIGTLPSLAIGESATLTKDFTVPAGTAAVDNVVTACGTDTLSLQVCSTDKHHMDVTQVLGENFVRPSAPLAVTGTDLGWRSLIGLLLLLGGVGLRLIRRRGRGQRESA